MISKLFNNPRVIGQTADNEDSLPEPAIAASTDNAGLIILNQEGREILISRATVNELCKVLKELRQLGESDQS